MKVDLYTRTMLTIIAACLVAIVARDLPLVGEAQAQMRPSKGPVYDADGALKVKISELPLKVTME